MTSKELEQTAAEVALLVEKFQLTPHPEGGYYREIYRSPLTLEHPGLEQGSDKLRAASTQIYALFPANDFSAFHRVTCSDEIWHLYAGGPLELHVIHADGEYERRILSVDVLGDSSTPNQTDQPLAPCSIIPAGSWQAARNAPRSRWVFCGCTVAPGFDFADFEMPPAETIIAEHPQHEAIIRELTKH
jgi:predicted cupin superfamily sugar epimerase